MPLKGDWKKPFAAAQEMVRNSLKGSAYLAMDQIRKLVAEDIILGGAKWVTNRNGKKKLLYLEVPGVTNMFGQSNRRMKDKKRLFHNTRFVSRTGKLLKDIKTARIEVKEYNGGATASLLLDELSGKKLTEKKVGGRNFVNITDKKTGDIVKAQARRRPFELKARQVLPLVEKFLKAKLAEGAVRVSK